jgi:predicted negative regulator of RcsB-dependent stress response
MNKKAILIIIVLAVAGYFIYDWYAGQDEAEDTAAETNFNATMEDLEEMKSEVENM